METTHVFIMVTADTCGACRSFKSQYFIDTIEKLKTIKSLAIMHINLPTMDAQIDQKFLHALKGKPYMNPEFAKVVRWYPSFFVFDANVWYNSNSKLNGKVANGIMVDRNGVMVAEISQRSPDVNTPTAPRVAITDDGIYNWVLSIVNSNAPALPGYLRPSNFYNDRQTVKSKDENHFQMRYTPFKTS